MSFNKQELEFFHDKINERKLIIFISNQSEFRSTTRNIDKDRGHIRELHRYSLMQEILGIKYFERCRYGASLQRYHTRGPLWSELGANHQNE